MNAGGTAGTLSQILGAVAVVFAVAGCGDGLGTGATDGAVLQNVSPGPITAVTTQIICATDWKVAGTANPLGMTLASGRTMILRFHADYSGAVVIADGTTQAVVNSFRWAADWQSNFLSVRYDDGTIADYYLSKPDANMHLNEVRPTEAEYILTP